MPQKLRVLAPELRTMTRSSANFHAPRAWLVDEPAGLGEAQESASRLGPLAGERG